MLTFMLSVKVDVNAVDGQKLLACMNWYEISSVLDMCC